MTAPLDQLPAFGADLPQIRTLVDQEELQLARVSVAAPAGALELHSDVEDAFAVIFQCGPLPGHTLCQDDKRIEVAAGPKHRVSVLDLAGKAWARVGCRLDTLHFRIPRRALEIFADRIGSGRPSRLHLTGEAFSHTDPVLGTLSPTLVNAIETGGGTPLFADHLLLSLLAHVTARYGDRKASAPARRGGLSPWQQRRALAMLDAADGQTPPLSAVAEACGVSVAHFSRSFKACVGVTPWAWHQRRRVEKAMAMLRDGALPLAQVAAAVGFADQSHFTGAFSRQVGMSPGRWRREHGIR